MSKSAGGKRAGKGSHGSTTKAGKVRMQTPKIPKSNLGKSLIPRLGRRRKFHLRFELEREIGQDWSSVEKKKRD